MREPVGDGLVIVGALTAVAGAIVANIALVRYLRPAHLGQTDRRSQAIAGLEMAHLALKGAVMTFGGITILLVGAIIGSHVQASWWILLPIGGVGGSVLTAALIRRTLAHAHNSEP